MAGKDELAIWEEDWETDDPPFHVKDISPHWNTHFDLMLAGRKKIRVFFPMCAKMVDMKWMYDLGHSVVGVEFIEKGCRQFFEENGLAVEEEEVPAVKGKVFKSKDGRIKLYACSIFDFNRDIEGEFDGIFDRGAFGAVKKPVRPRYADILVSLMSNECRYFLNTMHFDHEKFKNIPNLEEFHDHTVEEINETFTSRNCHIKEVNLLDNDNVKDRLFLITKKV